ncbi:MAG: hypothetical protein V4644_02655 [Patescibacteria group bacterium]
MKLKTWTARILGVVIVLTNVFGLIMIISDPVEVRGAAAAGSILSLLWIAFGAFLIAISLKRETDLAPDKDEAVRLSINRNWIFAFILLVSFIASAETWLMNDYMAGFTSLNLTIIFDLVLNLILFYFVVRLLQDKTRLPKGFLATIVVYSIGLAALYLWRGFPLAAMSSLAILAYFCFAILAPLTKRNHQIAHLVLLPLMLALSVGLVVIEEKPTQDLIEREAAIDQHYADDASAVFYSYETYLEKDMPSEDDIRDVQESIEQWNATADENIVVIEELQDANRRQLPSITKETNIEYWRQILVLVEMRREEFGKIQELMDYVKTLDLDALSLEQRNRINALEEEVTAIGGRITDAETRLDQSLNLE